MTKAPFSGLRTSLTQRVVSRRSSEPTIGSASHEGRCGIVKKHGTGQGHSKKAGKKNKGSGESHGNIARTILSNLNIFSNKGSSVSGSNEGQQDGTISDTSLLDADSSSTKSGRRPSVDTVSTYLSHDSELRCSRADLLDSSADDSTFQPSTKSTPPNGAIVGVDAVSEGISQYVRVVHGRCEGTCPVCLCDLQPNRNNGSMVVALTQCRHRLHLDCLNSMLTSQPNARQWLYIQCPVCMRIYGEKRGNQPPGSMDWLLLNTALPGCPGSRTIQITYHIVSGIQGPEHPNPGRPYYAVGFPRVCYLPDTERGREVLRLLRLAFQRRLVFTVGRSITTGREDVVTWNDIHHKTEPNAWFDPASLDDTVAELAAHGVH